MNVTRIEIVVDRRGTCALAPTTWPTGCRASSRGRRSASASSTAPNSFPAAVTQLLALEPLLSRRSRPSLSDAVSLEPTAGAEDFQPTVVIDCSGREQPPAPPNGAPLLRPLYNGAAGELAAAAMLNLGGRRARPSRSKTSRSEAFVATRLSVARIGGTASAAGWRPWPPASSR